MDLYHLDVVVTLGAVAAWLTAYAVARVVTRPASVTAAPATPDLPPEPPALASLLANRWQLTGDAARATLLDLGARGILEFRQPGDDIMRTTIHVRGPRPDGLTAYERMVFDRVAGLADGGMVPLTALTFRDEKQAGSWWKRLRAAIIDDARSRGISRQRLTAVVVTVFNLAALGVALLTGLTIYHHTGPDTSHSIRLSVLVAVAVCGVLVALASRDHGERDTGAGRQAAARWLGVKAWLQAHEAFAELPPTSVTVWDRYLSYGSAVGAARATNDAVDLGTGDRRLVWSHFGGVWHRVRVRYPHARWRYGRTTRQLVIRALVSAAVGLALLWALRPTGADRPGTGSKIMLALAATGVVYGAYLLVRALIDRAAPVEITGEAIYIRLWRQHSRLRLKDHRPWLHYLAVDDGGSGVTRAWGLPDGLVNRVRPGDLVTIHVRPWSRRVLTVAPAGRGRAARAATDVPRQRRAARVTR
ncbi:hypothetical protein GCM10009682_11240 [Luedemannella flava]|uniref:Predicted membrane protein YciQ-like C-terminal domain-containing protein n=1 Tax=Luedemannella flava TaxID=349316 RepID=A0ABN2LK22_9ACTN